MSCHINSYLEGNIARITFEFRDNSDDSLVDPSTVSIIIEEPDGTQTTYVYGTDAELVRDGVGEFHFNLAGDQTGTYWYRIESTGTGQAATESRIMFTAGHFA
jgi:hypothetical protein